MRTLLPGTSGVRAGGGLEGDGLVLGWVGFLVSWLIYEGARDEGWEKCMVGEIGFHRREGEREQGESILLTMMMLMPQLVVLQLPDPPVC